MHLLHYVKCQQDKDHVCEVQGNKATNWPWSEYSYKTLRDQMKHYLEVEDNGPYQPKDNWWSSICDVSGMNVNKFDLKQKQSRLLLENKSQRKKSHM